MGILNYISESLYLSSLIAGLLARCALDSIMSSPVLLTLAVIKRFVAGATSFRKIDPKSKGGAGGNGTTRNWLIVATESIEVDIFAKTAIANTVETFFLNLFDVYANELRFYGFIKSLDLNRSKILPADFFPRVYAAEFSFFKTSFLLLIENVDKTRSTEAIKISFPELSPSMPHPLRRVMAVLDAEASLHAEFFMRTPSCVWHSGNRPRFLQLIAQSTKKGVCSKFGEVFTPAVLRDYELFLNHYDVVRRHWDMGVGTLVHGDAHLGNYFFAEEYLDGEIVKTTARMYDFQCTAREHPIRDVVYHLMSSVDESVVNESCGDRGLLQTYVDLFNDKMRKREESSEEIIFLSFNDAWSQYRLHSFWVLAAFVISAGAGDLFDADKAKFTISRIVRGIERINAGEELRKLIAESSVKR